MNTANKVNIPVYLVSLKQDVARRERLKKCFPENYGSFQNVEAVDGRILPAKEYFDKNQGYFKKYKRFMSPAELGCSLSHIKALEVFLSSGNEFGLILEDDVIGSDEDIAKINGIISSLSEHALLLCGGQEGLNRRYQLAKNTENSAVLEVALFSYGFIHRTCCYIVSRKAAQEILDYHLNNHITLADKWGVFFVKKKIKIFYSDILKHPNDFSGSHIESERAVNQKTFIQKIFSVDVFYKVFRRVFWEIKACVLILLGCRRIK